jgi:hypothetical protein
MKSQKDPEMVTAFSRIYDKLTATGHQPNHHILNNKCSSAVQHVFGYERCHQTKSQGPQSSHGKCRGNGSEDSQTLRHCNCGHVQGKLPHLTLEQDEPIDAQTSRMNELRLEETIP